MAIDFSLPLGGPRFEVKMHLSNIRFNEKKTFNPLKALDLSMEQRMKLQERGFVHEKRLVYVLW